MTKYSQSQYQQVKPRRWKVHPIWRGIGCLLLVLIPLMSYAATQMVVQGNKQQKWFAVPAELKGSLDLSSFEKLSADIVKSVPQLGGILPAKLESIQYLDIMLFVIFLVFGFGLLTILYSALYSLTGPARYGPVDSPPVRSPRRRRV